MGGRGLLSLGLVILVLLGSTLASVVPKHKYSKHSVLPAALFQYDGSHSNVSIERRGGTSLRILCLGASITWGQGSPSGNGYRQYLQKSLQQAGYPVHFVGTQTSGNMENNANEGYPGRRIDQVTTLGYAAYGYLPNVILIHCGTNDFIQGLDPELSATRMGTMIDQIYSVLPAQTLVVASKLIPNKKAAAETGILSFNNLLDGVVSSRASQGKNVAVVDMHSIIAVEELGPDGTHPSDEAYEKMAQLWSKAITSANIPSPQSNGLSDTDQSNNNKCAFTPSAVGSPGTVQAGFGVKPAVFKGAWVDKGVILTNTYEDKLEQGVFWADFDGKNGDDYIHIDTKGGMAVAFNNGDETFGSFSHPANPPQCDLAGVNFADMDGDGIAEYICVDSDGSWVAYAYPSWGNIVSTGQDPQSGQHNLFFADMNNDGLADVLSVQGGSVLVSYNLGGNGWENFRIVAVTSATDPDNIRFFDVNGDGRADYVTIGSDGSISASLNFRSSGYEQMYLNDNGIIMHAIAGANLTSQRMTFGRIRNTKKGDLGTLHSDGTVKLFENKGYNGIAYGEYVRYCDMTASGSDTYLTLGPSGSVKMYENLHDGTIHLKRGMIIPDQSLARKDVFLADINGDKQCDYIVMNNKTGALSVSWNQGLQGSGNDSSLSLSSRNAIGTGGTTCDSSGLRFADIDGDGKADYICISRGGDISISISNGNGWSGNHNPGFSAFQDINRLGSRDGLSFADIDGDGRPLKGSVKVLAVLTKNGSGHADYLLFDSSSGEVSARLSQNGGQSFGDLQVIYQEGTFIDGFLIFANVQGLGRADMINVQLLSAKGKMSANSCPWRTPPSIGTNPNSPNGDTNPDDPQEPSSGGDDGEDGESDDDDGGGEGFTDYDEDYEPDFDNSAYPMCEASFPDIDSVYSQQNSLPPECMDVYLLSGLVNMWKAAMDNYTTIINNGYDDKFSAYAGYVTKTAKEQVDVFMASGEADKYFTCTEYRESANCCSACKVGPCTGCSTASDCVSGVPYYQKITCPTDYKPDDTVQPDVLPNTTYTLNDADGFYAALDTTYGIQKSWITFSDVLVGLTQGCQTSTNVNACEKASGSWFWNYPIASDVSVLNPKDAVTKALGSSGPTVDQTRLMALASRIDVSTSSADILDAAQLPALSVVASVQAMSSVADEGAKIEQEERTEEILFWVTSILFIIPFAGEEAAAAGLVALRTTLNLVGEAGNVALGIYGVVSDPSNAFQTIVQTLLGANFEREKWSSGAEARRGMPEGDIAKLVSLKPHIDTMSTARTKFCHI